MSLRQRQLLTPEEYLAIERRSKTRNEYYRGEVFAFAGASRRHNRIVTNLVTALDTQLRAGPCNVYSSDMRVKISAAGIYAYPDVVVTCGTELFEDEIKDTLLNPLVLVEVLSESTEAYDRGTKLEHYRSIESVRNYLLVTQDRKRVELYTFQGGADWLYKDIQPPNTDVEIASIKCSIVLADIYYNVDT